MPNAGSSRPRPAFVEDWDDDAQTTLSSSRATANISAKRQQHDGSDSGYSSRAGTVASEPTGQKKMTDSRVDTGILERERQPYHMPPPARPSARRESSSQTKGTGSEPRSTSEKAFVHEKGLCVTCDHYGRHIEFVDPPRASSMAPNPKSSKTSKKVSTQATRPGDEAEPRMRRPSNQAQAPLRIYPPAAAQLPCPISAPVYGYTTTPMSPTVLYSPTTYSYTTTPISYATYPATQTYFPTTAAETRPTPNRRSSTYGEPIIQHSRKNDDMRPADRKSSNKDTRPTMTTHRSTRSIEQDRAAMPPPQRPSERSDSDIRRRPSIKKSATYNTSVVDHRRSQKHDERDYEDHEARSGPPQAPQSRPPPSSYRGPTVSDQSRRPQARNSVSYTDAKYAPKVADSSPQGQPLSRRTTVPTTTHEQKEADAEAYQRERSNMTSKELTHEKLKELKTKSPSSKSETGSTYSHKSHPSSSKDSSGRTRSHTSGNRTSIILNDGLKLEIPADYGKNGRPVSINLEGFTISVNSKDKDEEKRREPKLLESPPSLVSQGSRRSVATSSAASPIKEKETDDGHAAASKRLSQSDERRTMISSKRSSRQHSPAPGFPRTSVDHSREKRQSVDYRYNSRGDEYPDYGA